MIQGKKAIQAARQGQQLYCLNTQIGWVPVSKESLKYVLLRADRVPEHCLWVYGVCEENEKID